MSKTKLPIYYNVYGMMPTKLAKKLEEMCLIEQNLDSNCAFEVVEQLALYPPQKLTVTMLEQLAVKMGQFEQCLYGSYFTCLVNVDCCFILPAPLSINSLLLDWLRTFYRIKNNPGFIHCRCSVAAFISFFYIKMQFEFRNLSESQFCELLDQMLHTIMTPEAAFHTILTNNKIEDNNELFMQQSDKN